MATTTMNADEVRERRSRRRRRVAIKAACATAPAVLVAAQAAGPAAAHYVYRKDLVYYYEDHCVGARAEISHGDGGGYHKSDSYSWRRFWTPWGPESCPFQTTDYPKPPNYVAVKMEGWRWNGSEWGLCSWFYGDDGVGWFYNQTTTSQLSVSINNGQYGPCGGGTYQTLTRAATWNGEWQGGPIWSGNHDGIASRGGK